MVAKDKSVLPLKVLAVVTRELLGCLKPSDSLALSTDEKVVAEPEGQEETSVVEKPKSRGARVPV